MSFSQGFSSGFRAIDGGLQWRAAQKQQESQFDRTMSQQQGQFDDTLDETKRVNDTRIQNYQALIAKTKEMTLGLEQTREENLSSQDARLGIIKATRSSSESKARADNVTANLAVRTERQRGDTQLAELASRSEAANLSAFAANSTLAAGHFNQINDVFKDRSLAELESALKDPRYTEIFQSSIFLASMGGDAAGGGVGADGAGVPVAVLDEETGEIVGYSGVNVGARGITKLSKTDDDGNPVFARDAQGNLIPDDQGNPIPEDDFTPIAEFAKEFQSFISGLATRADGIGQGGQRFAALGQMGNVGGSTQAPPAAQGQPAGQPAALGGDGSTRPGQTPEPVAASGAPSAPGVSQELIARSQALEQEAAALEAEIAETSAQSGSALGRARQINEQFGTRYGNRNDNADTVAEGAGAAVGHVWDSTGFVGNHIGNGIRSIGGAVADGVQSLHGNLVDGFLGRPPKKPQAQTPKGTPEQETRRAMLQQEARNLQAQMQRQQAAPAQQAQSVPMGQPQPQAQQAQPPQQRSLGQAPTDFRSQVRTVEESMGRSMSGEELDNFRHTGSIQMGAKDMATEMTKARDARSKAAETRDKDLVKGAVENATTVFGPEGSAASKAAGMAVGRELESLLLIDPVWRQIADTPGGATYINILSNSAAQRAFLANATPSLAAEFTLGIESASARDSGKVLAHMIPQVSEAWELDKAVYTQMNQVVNDLLQARADKFEPVSASEAESLAGKAMSLMRQ